MNKFSTFAFFGSRTLIFEYKLLPLKTNVSKNSYVLAKQETNTNNNNNIDMEEYLKTDYDDMEYDDAIKNDKRSFCEFFNDRLKSKQMIVDTFYNKDMFNQ